MNCIINKSFVLFIGIIIIFSLIGCSTSLPEYTEIYFSKSEYYISVGVSQEINVEIRNAKDLFACAMEFRYNTSVVNFENGSFSEGNFWSGSIFSHSFEDSLGFNVCIGFEQNGKLNGDGELLSFKLLGITPNETALSIENVSLIDENGSYISGFDTMKIKDSYIIIQ